MDKNYFYTLAIVIVLIGGLFYGAHYAEKKYNFMSFLEPNDNQFANQEESGSAGGANSVGDILTNQANQQVPGFKKEDIVLGSGEEARAGDSVTVNYVGTLPSGIKFDASADHGTTGFTFTLGAGQVIKGWDLGVAGMKVGGKRKLTIPAELGYGSMAIGSIPANSTLIFEVELLKVEAGK